MRAVSRRAASCDTPARVGQTGARPRWRRRGPGAGPATRSTSRARAWRVLSPESPVTVRDEVRGETSFDIAAESGRLRRGDQGGAARVSTGGGWWTMARQGVTDIVRGDDLLSSAARQMHLYDLLGLGDAPAVLSSAAGARAGWTPTQPSVTATRGWQSIGSGACRRNGCSGCWSFWSGVTERREPVTLARWSERFELHRLPRQAVTFTQEDERWLLLA